MFRWFAVLLLAPVACLGQSLVVPVLNIDQIVQRRSVDTQFTINLDDVFGVEEIDDQLVRFTATFDDGTDVQTRNLDFLLFSNRTPQTRANFLGYVARGDYENSIPHRVVDNFVVQGGGFRVTNAPTLEDQFSRIPVQPPVVNEPGVSNTLGTLSMAKVGGDPNSATSQWFVSIGQNGPVLDSQNGGFTVFGRISQSTFDNARALTDPGRFRRFSVPDFFDLPADINEDTPEERELRLRAGAIVSTPLPTTAQDPPQTENFYRFSSPTLVPVPASEAAMDSTLSYSLAPQDNGPQPVLTLVGDQLTVDTTGLDIGNYSLGLTATDSVGNSVEGVITLDLGLSFEGWRVQNFTEAQLEDVSISGPSADPSGTGLTNFQRFAHGLQPDSPTVPLLSRLAFQPNNPAGPAFFFTLPQRNDLRGVGFQIEASETLSNFEPVGVTVLRSGQTEFGSQTLRTLDLGLVTDPRRQFFRVRVSPESPQ